MNREIKFKNSNPNIRTLNEAATSYADNQIPVFPLIPNQKRPLTQSGFKDATTDISVNNDWWTRFPDANIGMPTGAVSAVFVLDIDIKNGVDGNKSLMELENEYGALPETLVQITPSGGRHLLFRCPNGGINTRTGLAPGLDVRGDGGYIVIAPSCIDGVSYQFSNWGTEIADAPDWLIALIQRKMVSPSGGSICEGGRNEHIFREALKARKQEMAYEDAEKLIQEINQACLPPLGDQEVSRTLNSAYRYESDEIPQEIRDMNKDHAVAWVNGKCRVLRETIDPIFGNNDVEFLHPKDFKEFYSNRYIKIDEKVKALGATWFSHPKRREYKDVGFFPQGAPVGVYNLWGGFAVQPVEGDCSLFLKHIEENIANGHQEIYGYIIAWMADVVRNPDRLVGTALVLRGKMGVGKGVFANGFGSLFGRHYINLCQSNQLVGRFNGHLKDKVLLHADEAFWGGDKQAEGTLKSMVTEPYLTIEEKGLNAVSMRNCLHMIFSTNNDWAVPAGAQERRFFVVDVGDKRMQDSAYFGAIKKEMDSGGKEALLFYLMTYDLRGIDLRKFPQTNALWEQKIRSFTPMQKFWFHKLATGQLDDNSGDVNRPIKEGWNDGVIETKVLYSHYKQFVSDLGVKHKTTPEELGIELPKLLPGGVITKKRRKVSLERLYVYMLPSLEECREHFSELMNYEIEWGCDEESEDS
jgi:hypothetical protein